MLMHANMLIHIIHMYNFKSLILMTVNKRHLLSSIDNVLLGKTEQLRQITDHQALQFPVCVSWHYAYFSSGCSHFPCVILPALNQ